MIIRNLLLYLFLAPLVGGLLSGVDRRITARMQSRFGPPIWQGFYDVLKLFSKENLYVRRSQNVYVLFYLLFSIFTGALFFTGGDILLCIFSLTLAKIFMVLAGYKGSSPYSQIGAERELLQIMAYEPMILFAAIGMYVVTGSFYAADINAYHQPLLFALPAIFIGMVFILAIKFRKSPFDLSTSHHAHQEIVKGITTEFTGPALALIEIAHWYETMFVLGFTYLFFAANPWVGVLMVMAVYFVEMLIDNCFARVRWQAMLVSSWWVAFILGFGNILVLYFMKP